MNNFSVKQKIYELPIFLPDATKGVTKGVDTIDLINAGVEGVVVNTYHLMSDPGESVLEEFKGIKKFMNFNGLVVSDSGGWQVFSLIHRSSNRGEVMDKGVVFSAGNKRKATFTPEDSIKMQFKINSDIMICLDDFTPPRASKKEAAETVRRTIYWAKKSKREFVKELEKAKLAETKRPHLYAVVQGGNFKDLRQECAEALLELGFDGYGYGGYVIDDEGQLDLDLSEFVCRLLPDDKPKFALGLGKPLDMARLAVMGWHIFDCTLPTRDARHRRLYVLDKEPKNVKDITLETTHSYLYIDRQVFKKDKNPISENCSCHTCQNYTRAYLRHLFKIEDTLAYRLATIHNLAVYNKVITLLREN